MSATYVIGIDLGTTNCVLAYAPIPDEPRQPAEVQVMQVPQLVAVDTIESRPSLPSFTYLATDSEFSSLALPWNQELTYAVGQFASTRGADAPNRTVVAAKSWLCHGQVDRRAPLLPFQAPDDVPRISPVDATRRYLEHLVCAWNQQFPDAPIHDQQVVITVPASFDPVARELTREAANTAGLPQDFVLLEEPQAALYAWLDQQGQQWRKELAPGKSISGL